MRKERFGTAIVLCGGKSSRMGFDKSTIRINKAPIYDYIANQLAQIFQEVLLVTGSSNPVTRSKYRVILDQVPQCGPMGGILTGLRVASSDYVFFTAGDMPFVDLNLIGHMQSGLSDEAQMGAVCMNGKFIEPLYSYYSKALIEPMQDQLDQGDFQISHLIRRKPFLYIEDAQWHKPHGPSVFSNINYAEDLELLETYFGEDYGVESKNRAVKSLGIKRYKKDQILEVEDQVVREEILSIYINETHRVSMNYSPGDEMNLAVGHLVSQGVLKSRQDLLSLEMPSSQIVKMTLKPHVMKQIEGRMALSSGCGGGRARMCLYEKENITPIKESVKVDRDRITGYMKDFMNRSELFQKTGGVHSCGLYDAQGLVVMKEDIGRHNAADKVIGACFLNGVPMNAHMLLTSGRVSSDIMAKAISAGIPMVVSHSAPTDMAIQMAQWANLTLVGFVRGERMNLYFEGEAL